MAEAIDDVTLAYSPVTTPADSPGKPVRMASDTPSPAKHVRAKIARNYGASPGGGSMSARMPDRGSPVEDYAPLSARNPFRDCSTMRTSSRRPVISNSAYGSIYKSTPSPGPGAYGDTETDKVRKKAPGYSMGGKASFRGSFIGQAEERGKLTPGPGAHAPSDGGAFGPQKAVYKSKSGRKSGYSGGLQAPSFSFGSASTERDPRDTPRLAAAFGTPRGVETARGMDSARGGAGGGSPSGTPRSMLARTGSTLARSVYLSKGHERENLGAHSPGPAVYSPKGTIATGGAGVTAGGVRRAPSFHFGTSGRF
mmetsp:Transcript_70416/g.194884  ORF Transcript_70416/g.194884 Transcript_70416/m.194884 type:complete len:310 (-) Transcript_70416:240-1169(-)